MSGVDRMIEAAERIGAQEGLAAMSLRSVQAAAGQRNKSAAQYHFGNREGLIAAVVRTRMSPVNERRLALLLALDDSAGTADLVEVLVRPPAEAVLGAPSSCWATTAWRRCTGWSRRPSRWRRGPPKPST